MPSPRGGAWPDEPRPVRQPDDPGIDPADRPLPPLSPATVPAVIAALTLFVAAIPLTGLAEALALGVGAVAAGIAFVLVLRS